MTRLAVLFVIAALAATAQEHLVRGLRLYDVQQYDEAIREFRSGYAIDPDPQFLYALGQAQRKKGDCPAAIEAYRAYLRASPSTRQAQAAQDQITRCEASLVPPPVVVAPAPPPPRRRVWTWVGVGLTAAAVAIGAGLEIAAVDRYNLLSHTCAPPDGPGCAGGDIDALSRQIDAATGLFVTAGALAVGTIIAITLESRRRH